MTKHLKLYLKESKFSEGDFIPCEICEAKAVDIHHIEARGMGGTKKQDEFSNLMALCRSCHVEYGDISECKEALKQIHFRRFSNKFAQFIEDVSEISSKIKKFI